MNTKLMTVLIDYMEDEYYVRYGLEPDIYVSLVGCYGEERTWRVQTQEGPGCGDGKTILDAFNNFEHEFYTTPKSEFR
jgi:hypothetical protein